MSKEAIALGLFKPAKGVAELTILNSTVTCNQLQLVFLQGLAAQAAPGSTPV
jgi:hypothetical protein